MDDSIVDDMASTFGSVAAPETHYLDPKTTVALADRYAFETKALENTMRHKQMAAQSADLDFRMGKGADLRDARADLDMSRTTFEKAMMDAKVENLPVFQEIAKLMGDDQLRTLRDNDEVRGMALEVGRALMTLDPNSPDYLQQYRELMGDDPRVLEHSFVKGATQLGMREFLKNRSQQEEDERTMRSFLDGASKNGFDLDGVDRLRDPETGRPDWAKLFEWSAAQHNKRNGIKTPEAQAKEQSDFDKQFPSDSGPHAHDMLTVDSLADSDGKRMSLVDQGIVSPAAVAWLADTSTKLTPDVERELKILAGKTGASLRAAVIAQIQPVAASGGSSPTTFTAANFDSIIKSVAATLARHSQSQSQPQTSTPEDTADKVRNWMRGK